MRASPRRGHSLRAIVASVVAAALCLGQGALPIVAQPTASFSGWILGADGKPAAGFQTVLRDADSGKEFVSPKSGPGGDYSLTVPVGARYVLANVIAPDGSLLPVQHIPPIAVKVAGNNRLDVRFTGAAGPEPVTTGGTASEEGGKRKTGTPWWKSPGGIVGIVVGVGAVAAVAASGGGSETPAPPPVSPANEK